MGFGSWFTSAIDKITPWDRGGELERRKKREEEEAKQRWQQDQSRSFANNSNQNNQLRVTNSNNNARVSVDGYEPPEPKKPQNLFKDINKSLSLNKPTNTANPMMDAGQVKVTEPNRPGTVVKPTLQVKNQTDNRRIILPNGKVSSGVLDPETQARVNLERDLDAGKSWEEISRTRGYDYNSVKAYSEATRPNYGIKINRPNQSIGNRFRDIFDANTEADKWRRQEGNAKPGAEQKDIVLKNPGNIVSRTPIVGHVTKMVNTGIAQIQQMPATVQGYVYTKMQSDLTNKMLEAQKNGDQASYLMYKEQAARLNPLIQDAFERQNQDYGRFEKNKGGLFNAGTLYDQEGARKGDAETAIKDIALPTAVTALDIYTLGKGNLIAQGIKNNGFKATLTQPASTMFKSGVGRVPVAGRSDVAKLAAGNYLSGDLDVRAQGGSTSQAIKGGLLNTTLGSVPDIVLPALGNLFRGKILPGIRGGRVAAQDVISEADDASIAASAKALLEETKPRPIPVRSVENIPINKIDTPADLINVRNLNTPGELIQDVSGGESFVTPNALIQRNAQDATNQTLRDAAFDQAKTAPKPNPAIEGITPRTFEDVTGVTKQAIDEERAALNKALADGEISAAQHEAASQQLDNMVNDVRKLQGEQPLFRPNTETVVKEQTRLVDDYAKQLQDLGQGNGVNMVPDGQGGYIRVSNNVRPSGFKGKRITKAMWREEAERQLRAGEADPAFQKAFNDAADPEVQQLLAQGENPPVAPKGKPIEVKEVKGIDVNDQSTVPVNTPETPGQVRVTTSTDPMKAKTQAAADTQQVYVEASKSRIPVVADTANEYILNNKKQFTKRQVAAARNQRKLARQMAKAQEETADAMERINNVQRPGADTRGPGLVKSGEFKKGRHGTYETVTQADQQAAAAVDASQKSARQVIDETRASVQNSGRATAQDVANIENMLDSGRVPRGSAEYKELAKLYWESGTTNAQELALRNRSLRRAGTAKQLSNQAISKLYALSEDVTKITDDMIEQIDATATRFVELRDATKKAYDDFLSNPSKANHDNYIRLDNEFKSSQKEMAMAQYNAGKSALKGNTNIKLRRMVEDAAQEADVYTMDYVDASLLSSTGTFTRNLINAGLGSVEEGLFGGIGSRVASLVKGTPVGGGIGKGSGQGFMQGVKNIVDASKTRFGNAGINPIEHMKNWSTTGNQLGDSFIEGSIGRSIRSHYERMLKKLGYSGEELKMRANVMARQDPDNLYNELYAPRARQAAGLGSGITKRSTIEKAAQREIADGIAKIMGREYSKGGENVAKAITRLTIGFPSAVGRSIVAGMERTIPLVNSDTVRAFTAKSPELRAVALKDSIKKSGSAATVGALFYTLGANGMISGSYPDDPNERDKWEREGIKENSIKIGDAWYDIPSYMGSFGVPALVYASMGRNGGINDETGQDLLSIAGAISPTDGITDITKMLEGRSDPGKWSQNMTASAGRMATPYGSLLNQLSKVFDPTQKDTSSDTWVGGVLNKLIDGIPFADKSLPDKTDKEGNVLYNPSVAETMLGSNGAVQKGGEARSAEINQKINSQLSTIDQYGLLADGQMDGVLEGSALDAYNKAKTGKQLDESDIKALNEGLVKGVSQDGTDTAYLERGEYDKNLAVLKLKRDLMQSDPTVNPSKLEKIETAIKRGEVYKDNEIPYDMIESYQDIGVEDWRKMGIGPNDEDYDPDYYDPEMYQKLWEIDQLMTQNGVSYGKKGLDKNKYYLKDSKSGSGSSSKKAKLNLNASFGRLSDSKYAPSVKAYETIDSRSGSIPVIRTVRPNIVHKISASR